MTLTCSRCGRDKPKSEFHRKANSPTGRQGYCKDCKSRHARDRWGKFAVKKKQGPLPEAMVCRKCARVKLRERFKKGYRTCGRCQREARQEPDVPFTLAQRFTEIGTTMQEEMAVSEAVRIWLTHQGTPSEPIEALGLDCARETTLSALVIEAATAIQTERMNPGDLPYTEDTREEAA